MLSSILTTSVLWHAVLAVDNGFGRTPIMGYNSYNDVGCSPTSTSIENTIRAMSSKGLSDLGYKYFQIDCGWQGYERLSNGSITYDSSVFPNGIKPLSDLARSLGMKWSMYTDQGVYSCDTRSDKLRPGSLGYETQDAAMFAAWNTEYMKVDNCYVEAGQNAPKDPRTDFPTRYRAMWNALNAANIKTMLVCQWGTPYQNTSTNTLQGPAQWTPPLSTSYRVSDDIAQGWSNVFRIANQAIHVNLKGLSKPGAFADMDLLEVGNNGMTVEEQRSHFAIWATFKSALMISTNVPQMSSDTFNIVSNKDLIAINQDSLGEPIKLYRRYSDRDVYVGGLANGDRVVLILDTSNTARTLSINFADIGISKANVKNLWTGSTSTAATSYSYAAAAHGSVVLRLSSVVTTSQAPVYRYYEAESGSLSNGAAVASCSGCSGGKKVGNLASSQGSSFTIGGIRTSQTTSDVLFDYINCEVGYGGGTNVRSASISVNSGQPVTILFPLTGYNWDGDLIQGFRVRLSGFSTTSSNTIKVTAVSSSTWAPDFDRIGIVT